MEGEASLDEVHSILTHVNHSKNTDSVIAINRPTNEKQENTTTMGEVANSEIHNFHDASVQLSESAGGQKVSEVSDTNVSRASGREVSPNNATGVVSQFPGDNLIVTSENYDGENGPLVADDPLLSNSNGQAQPTLCGNEALNMGSGQECSKEVLLPADQTSHRMNESQYLAYIPELSAVNEKSENVAELGTNFKRNYDDSQEMQTLHDQLQVISRQTQDQIENSDVAVRLQKMEENAFGSRTMQADRCSRGETESVPIIVTSDDEVEIVCVKMNSSTNNFSQHTGRQSSDIDKGEGLRHIELEHGETCVGLQQNVGHPSRKPKKKHKGSSSPTEQVCSICLDEFDNKSFLDQCFHAFCYYCILQWAEVVKSCPLCKSSFSSVIHSVKSMSEYEQHFLPDSLPRNSNPASDQSDARRFRYRTTLTRGSQLRSGRGSWEARVRGREAIMSARRNKELAAREVRRAVYANGTYVQGITQQGKPRYRDISPGFFRANPACTHRLVPWLTRELQVLLNDDPDHVEFVRRIVLRIINKVTTHSDEFADQMRPFLHDRTDHFIHEFASFARAPFDMTAYDARAQYNLPNRVNRSDTPTVISHTSGWETPDFAPGPSTSSFWEMSPRSEAMQQGSSSSWSPPSTSAITVSQRQGVIVVTQDQCQSHSCSREDAVSGLSRCSLSSDSVEYVGSKNGSWSDTAGNDVTTGSDDAKRLHVQERQSSTDGNEVQARSRSRSRSRSLSRSHKHKHRHKNKHKDKHKHKHRHGHKCGENSRGTHLSEPVPRTSCVDIVVLSSDNLSSEELSTDDAADQIRVRMYKKHSHGHKNTKSRPMTRCRSPSHHRSRSGSRHRSRTHSSSRQKSPISPSRRSLSREQSNSMSPERLQDNEIKVKIEGKKSKDRKKSKRQKRYKLQSSSRPPASSATELEDGKCGVQCHSLTENEMKQEIDELEKRIASDKKRLLQLTMKKEQRKHTDDNVDGLENSGERLTGFPDQENDGSDLEHTDQ